jgi:uncharacterized protein (TIGR02246 family)
MSTRHAIRVVVPLTSLILLASVPGLNGWVGPRVARSQVKAEPDRVVAARPEPSPEEKAILQLDEEFVRQYDKGDSKALAAMFADDAEVVDENGERYQGRDQVEQAFADAFAESPGSKLKIEVESIRFLGADVAKEEGRSIVTPTKGAPISRTYLVLYVKHDGRWLISSVREDEDPTVRPAERLKELEWMLGEWVDEGSDAEVRVHCRWTEDGNFMIRSFTVKRLGKPVMSATQRVGWDPLARQFRSWEFDSEGGFGEGKWSRDGDRWVVKHTAVRPEGTTASATNILTPIRPGLVRWVSVDRVLGDEAVPDDEGYTLVHVAPAPGIAPNVPATPIPTPNPSRNPR